MLEAPGIEQSNNLMWKRYDLPHWWDERSNIKSQMVIGALAAG
jgi:hypothetical protein